MSEHRTIRLSKPKRITLSVLLGLVAIIFATHIYFRFHLDGVYDDLQMACDCNWEFKDGQIYMVTEMGRDHLGTYTRSGGRWVCRPLKGLGDEFYIESSLLGFWWPNPAFQGGGRFLPRRCFSPFGATLYDWHVRI